MHNSGGGSGSDSIGVELGEDMIGPFSTRRPKGGGRTLAEKVADALTHAYEVGKKDAAGGWYQRGLEEGKRQASQKARLDDKLRESDQPG
jgi:hypothetical protein